MVVVSFGKALSCSLLRVGGPYGQGVGLGVEDVAVQAHQVGVVGEQQVQILQRLPQEEALHLVPGGGVVWVAHIVDGGVPPRRHLTTTCEDRSGIMYSQPVVM